MSFKPPLGERSIAIISNNSIIVGTILSHLAAYYFQLFSNSICEILKIIVVYLMHFKLLSMCKHDVVIKKENMLIQ